MKNCKKNGGVFHQILSSSVASQDGFFLAMFKVKKEGMGKAGLGPYNKKPSNQQMKYLIGMKTCAYPESVD